MKINQAVKVGAISAVLALPACGNGAPDMLALKIELHALKQELEFVRQQTEDFDPRVRSAEQMAMQVFDERDAPVRLDCAHQSPAALLTRLAVLTAVCDEAIRYPGGYRIHLKLGNLTSARLDGLTLTLYAGEEAVRGRSARRLHHQVESSLPPGAWKTIDVEFDGLDAEAVGDLAIRPASRRSRS